MGAIDSSKDPRALGLFRDIMLASAAMPRRILPVMIDVGVDGKPYQEMHVDGGGDFNLAYIGSHFHEPRKEAFDTEFMRKLFDYATGKSSRATRGGNSRRACHPASSNNSGCP
jgi:hypothetical protein